MGDDTHKVRTNNRFAQAFDRVKADGVLNDPVKHEELQRLAAETLSHDDDDLLASVVRTGRIPGIGIQFIALDINAKADEILCLAKGATDSKDEKRILEILAEARQYGKTPALLQALQDRGYSYMSNLYDEMDSRERQNELLTLTVPYMTIEQKTKAIAEFAKGHTSVSEEKALMYFLDEAKTSGTMDELLDALKGKGLSCLDLLDEIQDLLEASNNILQDTKIVSAIEAKGIKSWQELSPADYRQLIPLMDQYRISRTNDLRSALQRLKDELFMLQAKFTYEILQKSKKLDDNALPKGGQILARAIASYTAEKAETYLVETGRSQGRPSVEVHRILSAIKASVSDSERDRTPRGSSVTRTLATGLVESSTAAQAPPGLPGVTEETHERIYRLFTRLGLNTARSAEAIQEGESETRTKEEVPQAAGAQKLTQQPTRAGKAAYQDEISKEIFGKKAQEEAELLKRRAGLRAKDLIEQTHDLVIRTHDEVQAEIRKEQRLGINNHS